MMLADEALRILFVGTAICRKEKSHGTCAKMGARTELKY
jgi:hypothetical protein